MSDLFDKNNFVYFRKNPEAVFFDNASTTHIHDFVLEQILDYYSGYRASPGRGGYADAESAESAVNEARHRVASFMGVQPEQILFTTGATQGLNWIAKWCAGLSGNVLISDMEHNSNIVPWLAQGRVEQNGLEIVPLIGHALPYEHIRDHIQLQPSRSVISISTKSNLTGVGVDWRMISDVAESYHLSVALDMSQSIMMDMSLLGRPFENVDWAVFSGHKIFGPTGIGILYTKNPHSLPPMYGGGGMVDDVTFRGFTLKNIPDAHQAGTPDTAGIIGMGACCELLSWYNTEQYAVRIDEIADCLLALGILEIPELDFLGDTRNISNIFSFTSSVVDISDVATLLHEQGIAVRHGKMCAYPYANRLLKYREDAGILRISTAPYNTESDCKKLVNSLKQAIHKLTQ